MRLRSLLFVPGDRPDRMAKALRAGADALILDLEDSVAAAAKPQAREQVAGFIAAHPDAALWVRVNPLGTDDLAQDLAGLTARRPTGLVLPKAEGGESLERLAASAGPLPVIAIATETPRAIFQLGTYGGRPDLAALSWGAEDLPTAVGAATSREPDGRYTPPYELARSLCLFGAAAAGVAALDTVYPDFRDLDGLAAYAARARRDGFTGMLAIHPAQVPVINQAFTPTQAELDQARAIVAAFDANPGAGAVSLHGRMLDRPHLLQAEKLLSRSP